MGRHTSSVGRPHLPLKLKQQLIQFTGKHPVQPLVANTLGKLQRANQLGELRLAARVLP